MSRHYWGTATSGVTHRHVGGNVPIGVRRSIGLVAFSRITIDPAQMGGRPCIRGLRVTVAMILGQLAAGRSVEDVLGDYPYLERDDVLAALDYAAAMADERELPVSRPA